ncbi:MAG: ribosomal L7Ae/L30e/S12e/Gadd45 family protein [Clostridia bacterium]|nr:ribosomal L7Ae/L30e/S12e/Gadd45 family protein [Clostridia bacterium]
MSDKATGPDRFLGLVGLCRRAGRVVIGAPLIGTAMRAGKLPALVLVAADVSAGSAKKLTTKCNFYKVPLLSVPYTKEALAHAVGKDAPVAALGILDAGIAGELLKSSGKDAPRTKGSGME